MGDVDPKPKPKGALAALAVTTIIGAELAITVVLGFYGGQLLDQHWGSEPWFLVAGVLTGIAVGIFGIIQTIQRFFKD